MSVEKMETSILEIKDKSFCDYSWDFKIPPKSRIKQNMTEVAGGGGFVFSDLKFTTGFLAEIQHELIFAIYANQINTYVILPCKSPRKKYEIKHPGKLELFAQNKLKSSKELKFAKDDMSAAPVPHNLFAAAWVNRDESWDDSIDLMKISFCVECEELGETILYANADISKKLKCHPPPLQLDASEMFMSKDLSDTTFICRDAEYPAHRFLLSCKSPVFKQMFQHDMKENNEGKIKIVDMDPEVLQELLRYLYCGKVKNMNELCSDLFMAAEKYQLDGLKSQCELLLLRNICPENAFAMFMLADTYNGGALKEKAIQVLKKHKAHKAVVPDSETFQEFCRRYPELMFELYKL